MVPVGLARRESTRHCSKRPSSWPARSACTGCRWTTLRRTRGCPRRPSTAGGPPRNPGARRLRPCHQTVRSDRHRFSSGDLVVYLTQLGRRLETDRTSDVLPDLISASVRDDASARVARCLGATSPTTADSDPRAGRGPKETAPDADIDTIIDALIGAVTYRRLLSHAPPRRRLRRPAPVDRAPVDLTRQCWRRRTASPYAGKPSSGSADARIDGVIRLSASASARADRGGASGRCRR